MLLAWTNLLIFNNIMQNIIIVKFKHFHVPIFKNLFFLYFSKLLV